MCEEIAGEKLTFTVSDQERIGDHRWWISDLTAFADDYPDWGVTRDVKAILQEIYEQNAGRWLDEKPARALEAV